MADIMDECDDSIGWGCPRPKFEDLLPSTPEHSDEDGPDDVDMPDIMPTTITEDSEQSIALAEGDQVANGSNRVTALKDYPLPGYDGVPQAELNQTYASKGVQQMKQFYTTWSNGEKSPNTLFVCIFTCPITGEHFACGNWENEKGVTMIGGVGWYTTKKYAMHAAAARALDCFSLRRCRGTDKSPFQRCQRQDLPYLAGDTPMLPELAPGVVLPTPFEEVAGELQQTMTFEPKKELHDWYVSYTKKLDNIGIILNDSETKNGPQKAWYTSWSNQKDFPDTRFTALFTCHLTGERFASGTLIGEEESCEENYWYHNPRRGVVPRWDEVIIENAGNDNDDYSGLERIYFVWYKSKKEAEIAAAGRAVDCLRRRDLLNDEILDVQYCREPPYSVENIPEVCKLASKWNSVPKDVELPSIQYIDRLTTKFDVPDLHTLIREDQDETYWSDRYRERRHAVESAIF